MKLPKCYLLDVNYNPWRTDTAMQRFKEAGLEVVDSPINIIVHTTVSKEYADELVQLLNAGRELVKHD